MKKDKEIVLTALQSWGEALEHADESLKKDREIVLTAVKQSGWALQFADKSLQEDPEILANLKKDKWYRAGKGVWDDEK